MNIEELEQKLSEISVEAAFAKNAAQAALSKLAELRAWITKQEIERLREASDS